MRVKIEQRGIYETLVSQLDRIARHNRQGSFHTKRRYYEAEKRFYAYLADEYHLQKLSNVSGKHLVSYVVHIQETGKSASTIKTDLAAIRFFHDKMDSKYLLPTNNELGRALAEDRYDYILALYLARYAGLRIHECFRIDTAIAEEALRENAITIKGKGGKIRTVPINEQIAIAMKTQLARTNRGHAFVPSTASRRTAICFCVRACLSLGGTPPFGIVGQGFVEM